MLLTRFPLRGVRLQFCIVRRSFYIDCMSPRFSILTCWLEASASLVLGKALEAVALFDVLGAFIPLVGSTLLFEASSSHDSRCMVLSTEHNTVQLSLFELGLLFGARIRITVSVFLLVASFMCASVAHNHLCLVRRLPQMANVFDQN